jgi:PAS domain S-box-containing protein
MIADKIKILEALKDNVKDPFIALDQNGNIILYNTEAEGLLLLENKQVNIFDLFVDSSAEKINDLFQKFFASNTLVNDSVQLELNSGASFYSSATLNGIVQKDEVTLLLTLKLESYQFTHTGKINLKIAVNGLDTIVQNKLIIDVLEEVKSKFPFTFIHKEMLRKRLNEFKEPFWIKDLDGNLILVNKNVSASLKLKSSQVEGKNESVFIPLHLVNFQQAINKFIQESLNFVVMDGGLLLDTSSSDDWETIEIPLCDVSNKVVAIVGIIQEKKEAKPETNIKESVKESKVDDLRFNSLLTENPFAIIIVNDENLEVINTNDKALELYNYDKNELLSKDLSDLYSAEDVQTILEQPAEDSTGGKFYGPVAHKKKNGTLFYVKVCKIPFKSEEQSYSFYIIKEVTEQLKTQENVQAWQSIYLNSSDLIFRTDSTGFINYINKNVEESLGYKSENLSNSSFAALFSDEDRSTINRDIFGSEIKESLNLTLNVKKQDESYLKIDFIFSPVFDYKNNISSFVISGKPKQFKKEINEKEIRHESYETKPDKNFVDFIGDVFHEILTPVNVILGFTDEMTNNESGVSKENEEITEILKQNKSFLLQCMNSSVELSNLKYEDIKLEISEIKMPEIVDALNDDFKEIKGEKDIMFSFGKISSSLSFKSDKNRFYTLVYNLLLIGTRLTKEKKIYFSASQLDESNFSFSIGDGYSSSSNNLMEKFYKIYHGKNISDIKNYGISKITARLVFKLLNILHGKVVFSKTNGAISVAEFVFPLELKMQDENVIEKRNERDENFQKKPDVEDEIEAEEQFNRRHEGIIEQIVDGKKENDEINENETVIEKSAVDFAAFKCLYIEDQLDAQVLFKIELNEFKKIDYALTLEEALPLLEINNYDVIFVDINLAGDYNGLDALKMIRKFNDYGKSPIIAVSAYLIPGDRQKYISAGFDDFIAKPLSYEKVKESFSRIFKDLISS